MKLLLVDGTNLVMRAAFGGELQPHIAITNATGMIRRAARQVEATHLVVAVDCPHQPSWRKVRCPSYKAHRTVDTSPFIIGAVEHWTRVGWWVADCPGYEADDVIATLAHRVKGRGRVVVCSADSDLLPLIGEGVEVLRPENGGVFTVASAEAVCRKYNLHAVDLLPQLKAIMGEDGDNIAGVPGLGPVKAGRLLAQYGTLDGVLAAAVTPGDTGKDLLKVAAHVETVKLALELTTLRQDAPVQPVIPSACAYAD